MNERIQKLAEQAAHDTKAIHNNAYWRMQDEIAEDATWREKFAELIVAATIDQFVQHGAVSLDGTIVQDVQKHFGIEE